MSVLTELNLPRGTDKTEFGREREKILEALHDQDAGKPRKLILLCDANHGRTPILSKSIKTLTTEDVKDPKKIFTRAYWAWLTQPISPTLTNVYDMGQMLLGSKGDGAFGNCYQEIHYQTGVGTDWTDLGYLKNMITMQSGIGVNERIKAGYTWLCNRYRADKGDQIFLVGFSRGALIARTIGGWVAMHGLLKRDKLIDKKDADIADMYELYKQKQPAKATYQTGDKFLNPDIEAELLWDTVPGLGILSWNIITDIPFSAITALTTDYNHLHSLRLSTKIKRAYHALALTEHKSLFTLVPWEKDDDCKSELEQCWFPGQHEDVGGGLSDDHGITYMTLAWMLDKAASAGLQFDDAYFEAMVKRLIQYYKNHKSSRDKLANGVRTWGLARTHDSQRDMSLFGLTPVQKSDRKPGWYYQISDRGFETSEPLKNTGETIHKSVRLRYGHKDREYLGASGGGRFNPYALNGFEPEKDAATGKYSWKYSSSWYGDRVIPEAEIKTAGYEAKLIALLNEGKYGDAVAPEEKDPASYEMTSGLLKNLAKALHRDI